MTSREAPRSKARRARASGSSLLANDPHLAGCELLAIGRHAGLEIDGRTLWGAANLGGERCTDFHSAVVVVEEERDLLAARFERPHLDTGRRVDCPLHAR